MAQFYSSDASSFDDVAQRVADVLGRIAPTVERKRAQVSAIDATLEREQEILYSEGGDASRATSLHKQRANLHKHVAALDEHAQSLADCRDLFVLAFNDDDDVAEDCRRQVGTLFDSVSALEVETLLSRSIDANGAYLHISAGSGGTDSCDFAAMLVRMWTRWSNSRGFNVSEISSTSGGDSVGFRRISLRVDGCFAYGLLSGEEGVHRLVRISPFDSGGRRHTSFARLQVDPVDPPTDAAQDLIPTSDLRVDTFRASGSGGQHVNKTDSAVRIVHLPTGITVSCQSSRSQHRNRAEALRMLNSRMRQRGLASTKRELKEKWESLGGNDFGGEHRRSYVLHPSMAVKDRLSGVDVTGNGAVSACLDGDIDVFINAAISLRGGQRSDVV
jgi:peptide chain release factor 2